MTDHGTFVYTHDEARTDSTKGARRSTLEYSDASDFKQKIPLECCRSAVNLLICSIHNISREYEAREDCELRAPDGY